MRPVTETAGIRSDPCPCDQQFVLLTIYDICMRDMHNRKVRAGELREQIDLSKFKHSITSRVRTYDVDRQNIVHNAVYLYWLEVGRVEYFRALGLPIDAQTF